MFMKLCGDAFQILHVLLTEFRMEIRVYSPDKSFCYRKMSEIL